MENGTCLDELDRKIISLILNDARVPFLEVARECNVSGAAIHQRIQRLTKLGVIRGTQYNVSPALMGYETCAFIGLNLRDPSRSDKVVKALEKVHEVVECHQTTGAFDLFVKVFARNNHDLLDIIHEKLQPLGLSRSETIISFDEPINRTISLD